MTIFTNKNRKGVILGREKDENTKYRKLIT